MGKFFSCIIIVFSWCLGIISLPFSQLYRRCTGKKPRDTSWESGRDLIFSKGIVYWEEQLKDFRMNICNNDILEVGSGNGQWLIACRKMQAGRVVGVEPGKAIRDYSIQQIEKFDATGIEVQDAAAEELPFPDNSFDCLLCLGVFMFTDQEKALSEFFRVLKPGGQMLLTVNGLGYFLMRIRDGLLFGNRRDIRHGLAGTASTLLKWWFGWQPSLAAVNVREMKRKLNERGFSLERVWLHLNIDLYPLEHFGFPTNYAIRVSKS